MTDKSTTSGSLSSDDADAIGTDPFASSPVTLLHQRMIEDMAARNLNRRTQRSLI